ncbi:MAG: hypothetical protein K8U57_35815 [Planctomycetes bacterium]|nr:hypothetical protein [Planctomycetota bacterium]
MSLSEIAATVKGGINKALDMVPPEVTAMAREGIKDVRQTMNEVVFSQPEHAPETGTPMNLTQREVYEAKQEAPQQEKDGPEMG